MKNKSIILIIIFAFTLPYALDPMYNYRYTLGSEILVPDTFRASAGFFTHFNEDGNANINIQLGLTDFLEVGAKYIFGTKDNWLLTQEKNRNHYSSLIDVGAKFAISQNLSLQLDVPMSINKDWKWGGIVSLTNWDDLTKNVSFTEEGRIAIGGASGLDNNAKVSVAISPNFQIGEALRVSIGAISSCSFENFKKDFMLDIMPRIEAGFVGLSLMADVSIGILTWDAKKYKRYNVSAIVDI